jgi:hypothetical protein
MLTIALSQSGLLLCKLMVDGQRFLARVWRPADSGQQLPLWDRREMSLTHRHATPRCIVCR